MVLHVIRCNWPCLLCAAYNATAETTWRPSERMHATTKSSDRGVISQAKRAGHVSQECICTHYGILPQHDVMANVEETTQRQAKLSPAGHHQHVGRVRSWSPPLQGANSRHYKRCSPHIAKMPAAGLVFAMLALGTGQAWVMAYEALHPLPPYEHLRLCICGCMNG